MHGRTVLVTGATDGTVTALYLARPGAHVIVHRRHAERHHRFALMHRPGWKDTMRDLRLVCLILAVAATTALAAGPGPRQERQGTAALEWLAGTWAGMDGSTRVEEYWMRPAGGVMLGVHRDLDSAGFVWFEYLRIETRAGATAYAAMPGGRPAVLFPMKEITRNSVVFENQENDFPQRIIYRLNDDGSLLARIEGLENGVLKAKEWVWKKVARKEE